MTPGDPFASPYWFDGWLLGSLLLAAACLLAITLLYLRRLRKFQPELISQKPNEALHPIIWHYESQAHKAEPPDPIQPSTMQLKQSEPRFQAIFDHAVVGIGVMNLERQVVAANPAICRMLGRPSEELIGRTSSFVLHPDDEPRSRQLFQDLITGKRDYYEDERRYIRKNGTVFWAHTMLSLVRDTESRPSYIVGMILDIDQQKRAQEQLRQSEARFRAMFENAAIGIALVGLDRRAWEVNEALVAMSGYSCEELMGTSGWDLTYAEDDQVGLPEFKELVAGKREAFQVEKRYVRKDGKIFWVRQSISTVRTLDGEAAYLVVMVEDIDQQKRDELALQESEARFRAMFDSSSMGIVLLTLDRQFIQANTTAAGLLGYTQDELVQLQPIDTIYPDDRDLDVDLMQELISGKRKAYTVEKRYFRKDGRVTWSRLNMSAVKGASGRPAYLVGIIEDINQQKIAAAQLRESEARFRAMFANASIGIALMSLDRRILEVNQSTERLTGYTPEEMLQINPSDLAHPEDRDIDRALFQEIINGQRDHYQVEKRYFRKDGSLFWGRLSYSTVPDQQGKPLYVIGLIADITEQKLAGERLAAQEREYLQLLEERVEERTSELSKANQRLTQEIDQRRRAEEALATKAAEEAVTAERTRLARDLHDAVTQTLFSASLIAEVLPELWQIDVEEARKGTEELRQLTRGALAEMRTLLLELRPATLTQTRLGDLLRQLTEALIGRARLPVILAVEGERRLPPEVQVAFYRIAQESLNNIFKYARATQVEINLTLSPAGAHLEIRDNGVGYDTNRVKPTSLGQRIMRERADAISADLTIASAPNQGTRVSVTWVDIHPDRSIDE